jgi:hypothetical protein
MLNVSALPAPSFLQEPVIKRMIAATIKNEYFIGSGN